MKMYFITKSVYKKIMLPIKYGSYSNTVPVHMFIYAYFLNWRKRYFLVVYRTTTALFPGSKSAPGGEKYGGEAVGRVALMTARNTDFGNYSFQ